ncbi:hypothetical protein Cgig2_003350 [Carnegiea gigantea]|uniref:Uncharacterized protein n=1 Tax=Carnegiea gigantea TaxID=171969 RepID=A0A9Q1QB34_9CARY|nr:hypothetical protein Cgig2_003350 [Carnegiea gigantea]
MYNNVGAGGQQLPFASQASPLGTPFYGAGSGFIRTGLSAYGERIFGSSSEYVQSNISRYLANPQYYFQVDDDYVRNKLKVVLFPFLHRGHWTRITEPMAGRLSYKPPIYDINAPDLYIPVMAFFSYIVLGALVLGLNGKIPLDPCSFFLLPESTSPMSETSISSKFQPEVVNWLFAKALVGWFLQVMLLKLSLFSLISGEAPFLDVVAYAGYAFTGISLAVLGKLIWAPAYYILLPWTCLCMGVFLVKTMKRVLYAEVRSYDSSKHHILLLLIALAQFPFFIWLGNISVRWLF